MRRRRVVLMAICFVLSAVAGWTLVTAPSVVVSLVTLLAGVAILALIRRLAVPRLRSVDGPAATAPVARRRSAMAVPRLLYYAGVASIAVLSIRPTPVATISDWLFLAALLTAGWVLLVSGRLSFAGLPQALLIGIGIFAAGAFASSLHATSALTSLAILARFAYLTVVWFWLGTAVLQTPRHIRTATACWVGSVALSGAAALAQLQWGDVIPGTSPGFGRMTGLAQHVNDLGASSAVVLVPAMMLPAILSGAGKIVAALVILPLVATGLLLSGSVGGFAAAMAGALFWVGMGRLTITAVLGGVAVGSLLVIVLAGQQGVAGLTTLTRFRDATDAANPYCTLCSRLESNRAAWNTIESSPLIGAGMTGVTETGDAVHNILLGAWFEAGLLGVLGMGIVLLSVIMTGVGVVRGAQSPEEWIVCLALLASLVSFLAIAMAQPILFQRYGWLGVALLLAARRQQTAHQPSAATQTVSQGRPGLAVTR